jgi:hypothetical protein
VVSFLRDPNQRPVCISAIPIRATCPSHLILLDPNNILQAVPITSLLITQFSAASRYAVPPPPPCSNISVSTLLSHIVATSSKKWCHFVSASDLNIISVAAHLVDSSSRLDCGFERSPHCTNSVLRLSTGSSDLAFLSTTYPPNSYARQVGGDKPDEETTHRSSNVAGGWAWD